MQSSNHCARISPTRICATYLGSNRDAYELCIELLMQMHGRSPSEAFDARAFEVSERARARSLLDMLSEAGADIRQGVDPALLDRERRLQQRINATEQERIRLLGGRHDDPELESVKKTLGRVLTEYQDVHAEIRQKSPRYAALARPQALSVREIQEQVLDEDTLLLEYGLGHEKSHLWAVTRTSITSFELPARTQIEAAARRAYELLIVGHARARKREAELALEELSRMVLGPVAGQLGRRRLLIVAEVHCSMCRSRPYTRRPREPDLRFA